MKILAIILIVILVSATVAILVNKNKKSKSSGLLTGGTEHKDEKEFERDTDKSY